LGKKTRQKVAKLQLAAPSTELKLDLACGANCAEGFEGVDRTKVNDRVLHVVDLTKFPWPWDDSSVSEVHCSHFVEHLPARDVDARDALGTPPVAMEYEEWAARRHLGKDFFFAFFDEVHRILKPGSFATVITPSVRSERAFQDPTHRRFYSQATWFYLSAPDRKGMGLAHYPVSCDFEGNIMFTHDAALGVRAEEVRQQKFLEAWNAISDYVVKLKAVKPIRT
jgi:hypothetical protein